MLLPSRARGVALLAAALTVAGAAADDPPPARVVPGWGRVVDPALDCATTFDEPGDRLTIAVPASPHLLSAELASLPMSAPRVVQGTSGDFRMVVRVGGRLDPGERRTTRFDPYHGAGLLVWQDDRNYLRLERAVGTIRGHAVPYLNFERRQEGRLGFSDGIRIKDHPTHLKIERKGDVVRAWWSPDGSRWSPLPEHRIALAGRVDIGVVAINSSRHPYRAELDGFRVDFDLERAAPGGPAWPDATRDEQSGEVR